MPAYNAETFQKKSRDDVGIVPYIFSEDLQNPLTFVFSNDRIYVCSKVR